jgi:signal transduction histidine kinase
MGSVPDVGLSGPRTVLALVAVLATATLCGWPLWRRHPVYAPAGLAVVAAFVLCGLMLMARERQRPTGRAFIVGAFLWCLSYGGDWTTGPLPWLSVIGNALCCCAFGAAGMLLPEGKLDRQAKVVVVLLFVGLPGVQLPWVLSARPEEMGFAPGAWWPTPFHNGLALTVISDLLGVIFLFTGTVFLTLMIRRYRRLRAVDRTLCRAVLVVLGVGGFAATIVYLPYDVSHTRQQCDLAPIALSPFFVILLLGCFYAIMQQRLAYGEAARQILTLPAPAGIEGVQEALRSTLHEPTLQVFPWNPDRAAFVDDARDPIPAVPEDVLTSQIRAADGEPLALVVADSALAPYRDLVETGVGAAALTLDSARMQHRLLDQLDELRASRERLVDAQNQERRRLERDLHDGVQQRLLTLSLALGGATPSDDLVAVLGDARTQVGLALAELRHLARGLHPALLGEAGLLAALEAVAEQLPVPVVVEASPARMDPLVETTAYYVACEALTNTVRHAQARQAVVTALPRGEDLVLTISDDGMGGAVHRPGGGLAGLCDRLAAVGGQLSVDSPDGGGTRIRAVIPCG